MSRSTPLDVVKTDPDPTEAVKEALTLAIKNLDERVGVQFKGIDDSTRLAREELRATLIALNNTINEKFLANKDLVDQLAKANAVALSAALQTQKESAAKSEVSMADLLKQLQVSFDSANKATNEKIDRLTSRLDTGEGRSGGTKETHSDNRVLISIVIAAVAVLISLGSVFVKLVSAPSTPQILYVPAPGATPMIIPPQNNVPR